MVILSGHLQTEIMCTFEIGTDAYMYFSAISARISTRDTVITCTYHPCKPRNIPRNRRKKYLEKSIIFPFTRRFVVVVVVVAEHTRRVYPLLVSGRDRAKSAANITRSASSTSGGRTTTEADSAARDPRTMAAVSRRRRRRRPEAFARRARDVAGGYVRSCGYVGGGGASGPELSARWRAAAAAAGRLPCNVMYNNNNNNINNVVFAYAA